MRRRPLQKLIDTISFPLRAVSLFHEDRFGLSCLASERFDYVAKEIKGLCLDIGCGYGNRFINEYCGGRGKGIDVFQYEGLSTENLVTDLTKLPFADNAFDSVTFIANINHAPRSDRDAELAEAYRCLKPNGNIIVTMGNPIAEVLTHKMVLLYDTLFGTHVDMDSERGMDEEEEYYLLDGEIKERLMRAGFTGLQKKYFWTQWGLNHLIVGQKTQLPQERSSPSRRE